MYAFEDSLFVMSLFYVHVGKDCYKGVQHLILVRTTKDGTFCCTSLATPDHSCEHMIRTYHTVMTKVL